MEIKWKICDLFSLPVIYHWRRASACIIIGSQRNSFYWFAFASTNNPVQKQYERDRTDRMQKQEYAEEPKRREWIPLSRLALPLAIAHSGSRYITLHIESLRADKLLTGQRHSRPRSGSQKRSTIPIPFAAMMNPIII